jgi:hypothetical protein
MVDPPHRPRQDECDDLEIHDDAIIGTAFVWSLVVFGLIGTLGLVVWAVFALQQEREERIIDKAVAPPQTLLADVAILPDVRFTDITADAGLDTPHVSGAVGGKLLPETMGGGAAFFDADGDGDQDLLLVSGAWWPDAAAAHPPTASRMYRNDGGGHFAWAGPTWDTGQGLNATGVACGDWDADGRVDVFLAAVGGDRLYRNTGEGFEDVTASAGVGGGSDAWSSSPAFIDVDGDEDLDLVVPHYVQWSPQKDLALNFTLNGTDRAYGPPKQYEGAATTLWINGGDGTFRDASEEAGLIVTNPSTGAMVGKSLAVAPADLDCDGDIDLLVANDTTRNFFFRNRGDGTFEEVGVELGIAYDQRGNATGAMGIDIGHYRNDDTVGIGIGNFANEMTSLYVSEGGQDWFTDEAAIEGIGSPTRPLLSFGLFFVDYDLDGRLDLFQTNGHLEEEINQAQASQHYRQPAQLFWNAGVDAVPCFRIVPSSTAGDLDRPIVGRGAAYADIDSDGDLDFIITQPGELPMLLRNDQALGHHWLRVRLIDEHGGNRDAIGAWVELESDGMIQRRQVMPTRSYLSQVELPVTFGLGDSDTIDRLTIIWPDGQRQNVAMDGVDQTVVVVRP